MLIKFYNVTIRKICNMWIGGKVIDKIPFVGYTRSYAQVPMFTIYSLYIVLNNYTLCNFSSFVLFYSSICI